jgi:hypothetical protein
MGDIKDSAKLTLRTTRLFIDGWSNGFDKDQEPGETSATTGNSVTAKYTLLLWNLTVGQQYKVYRLSGARTSELITRAGRLASSGTVCWTPAHISAVLRSPPLPHIQRFPRPSRR